MVDGPSPGRHPFAMIFFFLFKSAAIVWFIVGGIFISGFVLNFVVSIVLIALDFWTVRPNHHMHATSTAPQTTPCRTLPGTLSAPLQVKNVSGRLLVGLRYWNEANESGSAWRFESAPEVREGRSNAHAPMQMEVTGLGQLCCWRGSFLMQPPKLCLSGSNVRACGEASVLDR